jgi:shikimate kinase
MIIDNDKRSIVIAGPPCSGKTSTGRLLAVRIDLPFFDLDECIEESASESIPDIFLNHGEGEFRRLESETLHSLLSSFGRIVLAVGGGCLLDPGNLLIANERGILITLSASNNVLILRNRLQEGSRPLARSESQFLKLLKLRQQHYMSLPNIIDTSNLTPEETVDMIMGPGLTL